MKKLATLFTASCREFKQVSTITTAAMFAAVSIILVYFRVEINEFMRIDLGSIANELVYYLFGPAVGGCYGGALDVIKYILKPMGAYFPGFTINAILGGVLYGMILYKRPLSVRRVLAAHFAVKLICNVILNTLWLSVMYGKAFNILVGPKIIQNLVMLPVDTAIFYMVARAMESAGVFKVIRRVRAAGVK